MEGRERDCAFRFSLAFYDNGTRHPISFESQVLGTLATEPRGTLSEKAWSELWLIFIPEGCDKTLSEMTDEESAEWRKSVTPDSYDTQFAEWFKENRMN